MYGDAISIPTQGSVRQHSTLSKLQLSFLDQWVTGDFDADFEELSAAVITDINQIPVSEQPDMLTKAAMDFCLADAFHPGCEMTWPMRTSGMYSAPFRLKHAPKTPKTDTTYFGSTMDSGVITMSAGPLLGGQPPGGITRWMAIPWQTDTASCRDGYTKSYDPYLPTFWPARVPNNILSEERYKEAVDPNLPEETRREAFAYRYFWLDDLPMDGEAPTQTNQINKMVKYFDKLAVVQARPGVPDNPNFPPEMQIGIVPSEKQQAALLAETMKDLKKVMSSKKRMGKKEGDLLETTVKHLSHKKLLNEQFLMEGAKDQLLTLIETEVTTDYKITPSVERLLNLLASKTHKADQVKTTQHQKQPRKSVGVPEKMVRFERFMPK